MKLCRNPSLWVDTTYPLGYHACCFSISLTWCLFLFGWVVCRHPTLLLPSLGLHPWWAYTATPGWVQRLKAALIRRPDAHVWSLALACTPALVGPPRCTPHRALCTPGACSLHCALRCAPACCLLLVALTWRVGSCSTVGLVAPLCTCVWLPLLLRPPGGRGGA